MSFFVNKQRKRIGAFFNRERLLNKDFTLISNDCWGGEAYKHLNLPFNTPFIGLMLIAPCYIKLLSNLSYYLAQPLKFKDSSIYPFINELRKTWKNSFPIATLGDDVEIQFLHYESEIEAQTKWERRVKRINWDNLFVKFDGSKDGATPELVQEFDKLAIPHMTLLRHEQEHIKSSIVVPRYDTNAVVQFERALPHIDLVGWLNGKSIQPSALMKLYNKIFAPGG